MIQRGLWVKDVDRKGIAAMFSEWPLYRWNETSPAQHVESGESLETQHLVVLPEGLTGQIKL
jgi:hypothetical protein